MKNLYIIGTGGFAREVAWLVEEINKIEPQWDLKGYFDDQKQDQIGDYFYNYKLLGDFSYINEVDEGYFVIGIGSGEVRKKIIEELGSHIRYATLIHPNVLLSNAVKIGIGSIITANNIFTTDVEIGNHVIVNLSCTIGHGAVIQDFVTINPGSNISGEVTIGSCTMIGTGVKVIQNTAIGNNTIIGAGATVVKEIPSNCTAVGSPAKPIKYR